MAAALHARGGSSRLVLDPCTLHSGLVFPDGDRSQHQRDLGGIPAFLLPPACLARRCLPLCCLPTTFCGPGPCKALRETKTEPN